jgi:hypothetical protein
MPDMQSVTKVNGQRVIPSVPSVEEFLDRLRVSLVPPHLHEGLALYLGAGILPGSFLTAVLSSDLSAAIVRADDASRAGFVDLVTWLYTHAPATAWGSEENVWAWRVSFAAAKGVQL